MRPGRSFLLLLIFLTCLIGLNYLFHSVRLFPSVSDFIGNDLLNHIKSESKRNNISLSDTAFNVKTTASDSIKATAKHNDETFRSFLDSLNHSCGQIRIMYYGDSQIEGDRVTSYLRNYLRKGHGGTGPGLFLPLMPVMYTKSIWLKSSSNWKRYNYISFSKGEIKNCNLGPFMAVCRFIPEGDSLTYPEKAYVRIRPSVFADSTTSKYDRLRIFYGNNNGLVKVTVQGDGRELFSSFLEKGNDLREISCELNHYTDIIVEFEGRVSPDIYGLSIESEHGIIVDNIPQRGSAGLEFTMVDSAGLEKAYNKLHPKLFVLQYGLNIVKNITDNYSYYQNGLIRQISLLKELSPSTPVLVIGVTDMAFTMGDTIMSYSNIPAIIDAQRRATAKTDATFWNSYIAMGGRSSIIKWAGKNPPLAQKDYVHFTYPGADTLSKILTSALFINENADSVLHAEPAARKTKINSVYPSDLIKNRQQSDVKFFLWSVVYTVLNYDPSRPLFFTSPAFWIFLLFVLAGYCIVYKKVALRNIYLFLVSLFFYYKAGGLFLFILIFVTVVDYSCGILIYKSKRLTGKRLFVLLSIISNLVLLGYFKYAGFIIDSINGIFSTHFRVYDVLSAFSNSVLGTSFDITYIILPVGISFFTFQSLSYTIDVYRGKMQPVRNIVDFGFYVSFFPHLVAGPIVRASVFIPQIYQEYHVSKEEFSHALYMISKGLIKKIIISNFIALNLVDRVFDAPSIYSGFENLLAIYGYGLQIYCDFSGYTDIAIGVALILGFRLPVNFNSPYKASSIVDFWKRWHISLSQWLRDYLYISLGGNRKGRLRTYFNLMITMLLGGLWHGASLKFIIWGGLHGIGLVINKIWDNTFKTNLTRRWPGRLLSIFITFNFVTFCWIFFRASDVASVKIMLRQIFQNFSPGSYMNVIQVYSATLLLMFVGYIIHFLPEKTKEAYRGVFIKVPLAVQLAIVMIVAIMLYQMRTTEIMPFIYFRF